MSSVMSLMARQGTRCHRSAPHHAVLIRLLGQNEKVTFARKLGLTSTQSNQLQESKGTSGEIQVGFKEKGMFVEVCFSIQ